MSLPLLLYSLCSYPLLITRMHVPDCTVVLIVSAPTANHRGTCHGTPALLCSLSLYPLPIAKMHVPSCAAIHIVSLPTANHHDAMPPSPLLVLLYSLCVLAHPQCGTPERPLILVLDSLDQLSQNHQPFRLSWMPFELPPHVKLIVSTLPEDQGILGVSSVTWAAYFSIPPTGCNE